MEEILMVGYFQPVLVVTPVLLIGLDGTLIVMDLVQIEMEFVPVEVFFMDFVPMDELPLFV